MSRDKFEEVLRTLKERNEKLAIAFLIKGGAFAPDSLHIYWNDGNKIDFENYMVGGSDEYKKNLIPEHVQALEYLVTLEADQFRKKVVRLVFEGYKFEIFDEETKKVIEALD